MQPAPAAPPTNASSFFPTPAAQPGAISWNPAAATAPPAAPAAPVRLFTDDARVSELGDAATAAAAEVAALLARLERSRGELAGLMGEGREKRRGDLAGLLDDGKKRVAALREGQRSDRAAAERARASVDAATALAEGTHARTDAATTPRGGSGLGGGVGGYELPLPSPLLCTVAERAEARAHVLLARLAALEASVRAVS